MPNHKIAVISWVAIMGLGALVLVQGQHTTPRTIESQTPMGSATLAVPRGGPAELYGKIRPPAEVFAGLLAGDSAADALTVGVAVSSDVPVASGVITLTMSTEDAAAAETLGLWPITSPGVLDGLTECPVGPLAPGRYRFTAILEFTPDEDEAPTMAVSSCLYLDVRADTIDATNVSFAHLNRLQLQRELEDRVLAEHRPRLAAADRTTKSREIAILKARDPDFVARGIVQIRDTDSDVARRIEELNQVPAQTETGAAPAEMGQQMVEAPVPSHPFSTQ